MGALFYDLVGYIKSYSSLLIAPPPSIPGSQPSTGPPMPQPGNTGPQPTVTPTAPPELETVEGYEGTTFQSGTHLPTIKL